MKSRVATAYAQMYGKLDFERESLFTLLQSYTKSENVLYPGCSLHITPSFAFKRVCYIDKSPVACDFFQAGEEVRTFIDQHKHYQGVTSFRFIYGDYTHPLNLGSEKFDLLLSLYGGRLLEYFLPYLQPKAYMLCSSSFSDEGNPYLDTYFELHKKIAYRKGKYMLTGEDKSRKQTSSGLKKHHGSQKFSDQEIYFLYQLKPAPLSSS